MLKSKFGENALNLLKSSKKCKNKLLKFKVCEKCTTNFKQNNLSISSRSIK